MYVPVCIASNGHSFVYTFSGNNVLQESNVYKKSVTKQAI